MTVPGIAEGVAEGRVDGLEGGDAPGTGVVGKTRKGLTRSIIGLSRTSQK